MTLSKAQRVERAKRGKDENISSKGIKKKGNRNSKDEMNGSLKGVEKSKIQDALRKEQEENRLLKERIRKIEIINGLEQVDCAETDSLNSVVAVPRCRMSTVGHGISPPDVSVSYDQAPVVGENSVPRAKVSSAPGYTSKPVTDSLIAALQRDKAAREVERKSNRKLALEMAEQDIGNEKNPKVSTSFQRGLTCLRLENYNMVSGGNLVLLRERASLLKDGRWGKVAAEYIEHPHGQAISSSREKAENYKMLADMWVLHFIRELPENFGYVCPDSLYMFLHVCTSLYEVIVRY